MLPASDVADVRSDLENRKTPVGKLAVLGRAAVRLPFHALTRSRAT